MFQGRATPLGGMNRCLKQQQLKIFKLFYPANANLGLQLPAPNRICTIFQKIALAEEKVRRVAIRNTLILGLGYTAMTVIVDNQTVANSVIL